MNKKIVVLIALFCSLALFSSCNNDDDSNVIDEEWKAYNEKQIRDVEANTTEYKPRASLSDNGSIYWKTIDFVAETETKSTLRRPKITDKETPYFTDSIAIRYEGSFFKKRWD